MKISTQLSVSSVILAAVISTGCSQQQVVGGSQVSGSSQMSGGSQVYGGSQQVAGGSQVAGSSQSQNEGGSQLTSQQQIEEKAPVIVTPTPHYIPAPVYAPRPAPTVKRTVRRSGIGLPPAKPGQCFAKVKQPAKYVNKSRRSLVKAATSQRVLVRGPQYGWATKRVLVRKAAYKTRTIPAQYRHTTQRVLVKPAYYKWSKKAQSKVVRIDHMTGEILCRVKVPAVYKNVTKKVLVRPARTHRTLVPAAYKTVKTKKLVSPAQYRVINKPAQYKTTNYRVKVGSSRIVWRQVACKAHAKPQKTYYKKAAYHRPAKQYRKAVVKQYRKPVRQQVRRSTQQYQKPAISLRDYYAVMNAGKKSAVKKKVSSKKKVYKRKAVKSVKSSTAKTLKQKMAPKAKTKVPVAAVKKTAPKVKAPVTSAKKDDAKKQMSKENVIRSIQKALKDKGFDPGTVDGKMGSGTAAALKAFQSSRGLPVGRLTKDTFRALGLIK